MNDKSYYNHPAINGNPILLHYRAGAGHIQGVPIDAAIEEDVDQIAFLYRELSVH